MNIAGLAELLLALDEKIEMQHSVQLLEAKRFSEFYEANQDAVRSILFVESLDEFLDFSKDNSLDVECFCAAFLCAKGCGIQIGGYEDDLTQTLTAFFRAKGFDDPEIFEVINGGKIYTDCSDCDNFKTSMTAINRALASQGVRAVVFEDFVYCDCEYTVLMVDSGLADRLTSLWQSENFEIYL